MSCSPEEACEKKDNDLTFIPVNKSTGRQGQAIQLPLIHHGGQHSRFTQRRDRETVESCRGRHLSEEEETVAIET